MDLDRPVTFSYYLRDFILTRASTDPHYRALDKLAIQGIFTLVERYVKTFITLDAIFRVYTFLGLGAQYTQRRNFFLDCIFNKFHVELASASQNTRFPGSEVYLLSEKTPTSWYHNEKSVRQTLVSFVPPSSGMFVWVRNHIFLLQSLLNSNNLILDVTSLRWPPEV